MGKCLFDVGKQRRPIDRRVPGLNLPVCQLSVFILSPPLGLAHQLVERGDRNADAFGFLQPPFLIGQHVQLCERFNYTSVSARVALIFLIR
jgi:hypothetical protein